MSIGSGTLTVLGAVWAACTAGFVTVARTTGDACAVVSALVPNDGGCDAAILALDDCYSGYRWAASQLSTAVCVSLLVFVVGYRLGISRRRVDPPAAAAADPVSCQVCALRAAQPSPAAPAVAPAPAVRRKCTKGALAGRSVSAASLDEDGWRSW